MQISPSARIAYLLLPSSGVGSLSIQLPANSWHRHLKVVFRGGDVGQLTWVPGAGAVLADAALMPTRVSQTASIELIRRRAAPGGGDAIWYLLQTERLSTLIRVGDDSTVVTQSTTPKVEFRVPRAMRLSEIRGALAVAATNAATKVEFDVRKRVGTNWVSLFNTRPTFDPNEPTTQTAAVPSILNLGQLTIDDDQLLGLFVTAAPTAGTTPKGLKIWVVGQAG